MGLFGEAMKALRTKKRWSTQYLAIMLDIAQSYLSRLERSLEIPSADLARRIAQALGGKQESFVEFARADKKKFFNKKVDDQYPRKENK
jgi:transcriptional regulator with XRE-family HTH domain